VRECRRHRATNVLIMCSTWAEGVMKQALPLVSDCGIEWELLPVPSRFFGGSIGSAGLLVVDDFIQAWEARTMAATPGKTAAPENRPRSAPGLIAVPHQAFDRNGRDLVGRGVHELEARTGCPLVLC
jgi:hypothetical protein